MEFRAFLPHKPPFCNSIVQCKHNKTINQLGKSQKKTTAEKANALTQIQELSFSSAENFFIYYNTRTQSTRGYWPKPKLVTNSFGNTNFMQSMGRLSMHSKCLEFIFLLSLGEGGLWRIFFIFSLFPSSSQ